MHVPCMLKLEAVRGAAHACSETLAASYVLAIVLTAALAATARRRRTASQSKRSAVCIISPCCFLLSLSLNLTLSPSPLLAPSYLSKLTPNVNTSMHACLPASQPARKKERGDYCCCSSSSFVRQKSDRTIITTQQKLDNYNSEPFPSLIHIGDLRVVYIAHGRLYSALLYAEVRLLNGCWLYPHTCIPTSTTVVAQITDNETAIFERNPIDFASLPLAPCLVSSFL